MTTLSKYIAIQCPFTTFVQMVFVTVRAGWDGVIIVVVVVVRSWLNPCIIWVLIPKWLSLFSIIRDVKSMVALLLASLPILAIRSSCLGFFYYPQHSCLDFVLPIAPYGIWPSLYLLGQYDTYPLMYVPCNQQLWTVVRCHCQLPSPILV